MVKIQAFKLSNSYSLTWKIIKLKKVVYIAKRWWAKWESVANDSHKNVILWFELGRPEPV